ncbi:zinc finger protein RFP-like isoform X2 [Rhineura floridana]|nr:zinc finger protein RFP-like isoform X2 [Rhineura floridana]
MAAEGLVKEFCDETTCPICLEYFREPVILDCGHNFCRGCLTRYWEESRGAASCPQCREAIRRRNFRPNRQLANVVEIAKKFSLQVGEGPGSGCESHSEPLKLFCREDEAPICVVCDRSKEHREHQVIPLEEASQEYKGKIQAQLQSLVEERQTLLEWKLVEEERSQTYLTELEEEKHNVTGAFERMHDFLDKLERFWLAELADLENEMKKRQEEYVSRLSEEISCLSSLITEMETKCQQPALEFLQDIRTTLSRYQEVQMRQTMLGVSPGLEERLESYTQKNSVLKNAMEKCEGSLTQALNKVSITLDRDTAHPFLIVTQDLKSVRRGEKNQGVPDNSERFDNMLYVLGHARFASGRYWWEVGVEEEEEEERDQSTWAVGVAKESVRRKGYISIHPTEGIWAVGKTKYESASPGHFWAFTSPERTLLKLGYELRKIRVSLDYDEGRVEFYDAYTDDLIFTFREATFSGERIQPFFFVWWGAGLKC